MAAVRSSHSTQCLGEFSFFSRLFQGAVRKFWRFGPKLRCHSGRIALEPVNKKGIECGTEIASNGRKAVI
jgi:hypothetical protein